MHYQYATLTICYVTATKPTTTPRPVHIAGCSVPIPTATTNEEQQLLLLLPRRRRRLHGRQRVETRRGAGPPCTFRYARPMLIHRQNQNHHQTKESGGFGTFSATPPSLGFEPTSAGRKKGMLPTVLRQDTMPGHGAFLTLCPSTALMQLQ